MDMLKSAATLILFIWSTWYLYRCWIEDPIKDRRLALCDRQASYGRNESEALFIREAGEAYVAQCFGVASR